MTALDECPSRAGRPVVSIIVVSYNTRELTLACLNSVIEQTTGIDYELIVVDNASEDGSAAAIAQAAPSARLIALERNIGFARANNLAAKRACGEFLLLLNPDTVLLDHAVERVVAFARAHQEAGIVGGRTFFADMSLNYTSCHGRPTPWSLVCVGLGLSSLLRRSRLFDPESLGSWRRDSAREVDVVTGCLCLIRRELWDTLGGFDESFFMYGEDTDLCIRAWKAGSSCMICPDARALHLGGQSEKVRADKMIRLFHAKAQLFRKHWSRRGASFGVMMLRTWALTRMIAFRVLQPAKPSFKVSYAAWREVWRRRDEWQAPAT
jgi:GT2 family glycosyltransferase